MVLFPRNSKCNEPVCNKCPEEQNQGDCVKIVGYDHLKTRRARRFRCKNKRLVQLAQPKQVIRKYYEEETARGKTAVEIMRTFEEQATARIKMLAYPKVRKLISSRDAYKDIIDKEWFGRFESLIQKSMLTMYSRLANVHLPSRIQREKWTKADWQRHCAWLKQRALPKMPKDAPIVKPKKVPIEALIESILKLSEPRHPQPKYRPTCGYVSTVKDATKTYTPTKRILTLAVPKPSRLEEEDYEDFVPFQVNPKALKFRPTQRIKQLAEPRIFSKPIEDVNYTEFGIVKNALSGVANARVVELSKPKDKGDDDDMEEKPLVNPRALKAKPTKRILELAEPRRLA